MPVIYHNILHLCSFQLPFFYFPWRPCSMFHVKHACRAVSVAGGRLEEHPVGVMMACENLNLLQHPLVEAWLCYKWCSYARWLFLAMLLLRVFLVAALMRFLLYTT